MTPVAHAAKHFANSVVQSSLDLNSQAKKLVGIPMPSKSPDYLLQQDIKLI